MIVSACFFGFSEEAPRLGDVALVGSRFVPEEVLLSRQNVLSLVLLAARCRGREMSWGGAVCLASYLERSLSM